jgi:hypothetical protein
MRCPGYDESKVRPMDPDAFVRLTSEGTARQYHLAPANPHLFCGCGAEASDCHPGRCCQDDEWGQCTEHGKAAPPEPLADEAEFTDPLFPIDPVAQTVARSVP